MIKKYKIRLSDKALKELAKLDKSINKLIMNWIIKNLEYTNNPRQHGKALTGNLKGIWRYRVGDYRILAEINDDEIFIFIFEIAHRSEIYK